MNLNCVTILLRLWKRNKFRCKQINKWYETVTRNKITDFFGFVVRTFGAITHVNKIYKICLVFLNILMEMFISLSPNMSKFMSLDWVAVVESTRNLCELDLCLFYKKRNLYVKYKILYSESFKMYFGPYYVDVLTSFLVYFTTNREYQGQHWSQNMPPPWTDISQWSSDLYHRT